MRIQAEHIIASRELVYQPGQVVIKHGTIVEVTSRCGERPDLDLGPRVLMPGLVNPHTHLEFSHFEQAIAAGANFPEWISAIVKYRRNRDEGLSSQQIQAQLTGVIRQGLLESQQFGVVALCDIVTMPWQVNCMVGAATCCPASFQSMAADIQALDLPGPCRPLVLAALEQIGLDQQRAAQSLRWREAVESDYLSTIRQTDRAGLIGLALSPHASYSTQWPLFLNTVRDADATGRLLVTHLAESQDEREWLDGGTGAFRVAFERLGIAVDNLNRPSIEQIIRELGGGPRALLVHGNYLTDSEIQLAANYRTKLSIVYCPRTHSHFGHTEYPLEKLQQAGLNVVIGTDSRASNPDLNLWQEARHAINQHNSLTAEQAFHAITQGAADALGIGDQYGSIAPGFHAAMCIANAPHESIESSKLIEHLLSNIDQVGPLDCQRHFR